MEPFEEPTLHPYVFLRVRKRFVLLEMRNLPKMGVC
jgi:hypothetical protein